MCDVGINCSLSSFPTHQHRHASMERTDKQENMYDGENRQVFSADVSSVALAAGADGLLICGRNAFDVPES